MRNKVVYDGINQEKEDIFAEAQKYTDACVEILVEAYDAGRDNIKTDIFYYQAISQLVQNQLKPPTDAVEEAIAMYTPAVLGLSQINTSN